MQHITFSISAGGALKYGLKNSGENPEFCSLFDTLNVGPINDFWNAERKKFMTEVWQSSPYEISQKTLTDWKKKLLIFGKKRRIKRQKLFGGRRTVRQIGAGL